MGTMPLLMPKMGMKMKLWSLKYAPKTAAAVDVNAIRMRLKPKTMTEPMADMMMDGRPTA